MNRIAAGAGIIAVSRIAHRPLDVLPEAFRPRDEADAYGMLDAVHVRLSAAGFGPRIGYKIACTTKVMRDYLGIRSPVAAGLFAAGRHASGAALPAADYLRVGIECEIAVQFGRNVHPSEPHDRQTLAEALSACMPAIEIVDDRYVDWRKTDAPTLIADDFFSAGCVLGAPVGPERLARARGLVGTTTINGIEAGRGRGSDVMGHPLEALSWLATHLATRGRGFRTGEIVLTGSLVETKWLALGDRAAIAISGLGAVEAAIV